LGYSPSKKKETGREEAEKYLTLEREREEDN
jgi:hypothetical protein